MAENTQSPKKQKASHKLSKDADIFIIYELANVPFSQKTQTDILNEVKDKFGVDVSVSRISQIKKEKHEEILVERNKIREEVYFTTPIADPAWRVQKWADMYKSATNCIGYTKDGTEYTYINYQAQSSALRGAKAELGDDINKLADAIKNQNVNVTHNVTDLLAKMTENLIDKIGGLPDGVSPEDISE